MGAAPPVPVVAPDDLARALEPLRTRLGFRLAATVLDPPAVPLDRYEPPARLALLLGCASAPPRPRVAGPLRRSDHHPHAPRRRVAERGRRRRHRRPPPDLPHDSIRPLSSIGLPFLLIFAILYLGTSPGSLLAKKRKSGARSR